MRVAFRTDASLQIGSGHVMRCLTLGDALAARGVDCQFISREHPGHLLESVRRRGFAVNRLAAEVDDAQHSTHIKNSWECGATQETAHANWLGTTWQTDAEETLAIVASMRPDWLVVDHYALDERWERMLRPHCGQLFAVDDLADRSHDCDLLLDQNLGRDPAQYLRLVPRGCSVLTGPSYALLRPEFAQLRDYSLQRRRRGTLQQLLITMGGVDAHNATGRVLAALASCVLPDGCRITVVMGAAAPWLDQVRSQARRMTVPTDVIVNVDDMAQRMADADLAIGGAGGTVWECCCLGLPTLIVVLAENQQRGAVALQRAGAALLVGKPLEVASNLPSLLQELRDPLRLASISAAASAVADGCGIHRVLQSMDIPNRSTYRD